MSLTHRGGSRNGVPPTTAESAADLVPRGRGRVLFVPDVREMLLGGRKSSKWIRKNFAPEYKHYLGRDPYWLEADAYRWIESRPGGV